MEKIADSIMNGDIVHVGGGQAAVAEILAAVVAAWEKMSMGGWRHKLTHPSKPNQLTPKNLAAYCGVVVDHHRSQFPAAYGCRGFSVTHYNITSGKWVKGLTLHHDAGQGVWAVIECDEFEVTSLKFGVLNVHWTDPNFSEYSEKLGETVDQLAELVAAAQKRGSYCYLSPVDDD